jgi:Fur family ferric uptake transcriptional regulator
MDYPKRLRSREYRFTAQRRAVLDVLEENEGRPLNPEQVHRLASEKVPGMGLATAYRTLELFRELGIALTVHLHRDSQHYEINNGRHHHHLVCVSCGSVEVFEGCMIDRLEEIVHDESDFLVTSHCLSVFGYCQDCLPGGRSGKEITEQSREGI